MWMFLLFWSDGYWICDFQVFRHHFCFGYIRQCIFHKFRWFSSFHCIFSDIFFLNNLYLVAVRVSFFKLFNQSLDFFDFCVPNFNITNCLSYSVHRESWYPFHWCCFCEFRPVFLCDISCCYLLIFWRFPHYNILP